MHFARRLLAGTSTLVAGRIGRIPRGRLLIHRVIDPQVLPMSRTALFLALAALVAIPALAQDKSITFDNLTPNKTVRLQNGGTLAIGVDGNVTAKCLNADADAANCDDIGTSSGSAPTVSLAGSAFSEAPDANNAYPAGTTFTLTPTVTSAEACIRLAEVGTPVVANWPVNSLLPPPVPGTTITLPTVSANYGFLLRCFSAGGATTSAPLRVSTNSNSVGGGGGDQCNAGAVSPPAFPPEGYTRSASPTLFTQLLTLSSNFCQDFPNTGGGICRLNASRNRYTSIRFQVPLDTTPFPGLAKEFNWNPNQIDGEADENAVYLSISQCPGDFRIPTTITPPDVVNDPTFSTACRNFVGSTPFRAIKYNIDGAPSNIGGDVRCGLSPGKVYYLNFILASPVGGIVPGEHNCLNPNLNGCGLQIMAE